LYDSEEEVITVAKYFARRAIAETWDTGLKGEIKWTITRAQVNDMPRPL
jgi:hypothetical protein